MDFVRAFSLEGNQQQRNNSCAFEMLTSANIGHCTPYALFNALSKIEGFTSGSWSAFISSFMGLFREKIRQTNAFKESLKDEQVKKLYYKFRNSISTEHIAETLDLVQRFLREDSERDRELEKLLRHLHGGGEKESKEIKREEKSQP